MRMNRFLKVWMPRVLFICALAACLLCPGSGLTQPDPVQMSLQAGEAALAEYHLIEAEQYFTAGRLEIERAGGGDPRLADCLSGLAKVYRRQNSSALADELQTRVLAMVEKRCGPTDRALVKPLAFLAAIARDRRQYARAGALLSRAIAIQEKLNGAESETFAMTLLNLADDYYDKGECFWAEQLYRRGITLLIKATDVNHDQLPLYLNNFAVAYSDIFFDHGEEPIYERAINTHHRVVGAENSDCIITLYNLSYAYESSKRYRDAEEVLKRAIALQAKPGDGDGRAPGLLDMQMRLAELLNAQGRTEEAEAARRHMLEMAKTLDVQAHRDEFAVLLNAGENLLNGDEALPERFKRALPWYEAALSLYERAYGTMDPHLIVPLGQLAFAYEALDRDEEARKCRQRVIAIVNGRDARASQQVAEGLRTLADWSNRDMKSEHRLPFLKEAVLDAQAQYPENNPVSAEALNALARASTELGRQDLAESFYKRAFDMMLNGTAPAHARIDRSRMQLIIFYQQHKKGAQASEMITDWFAEIERIYKDDTPRLAQRLFEAAILLNQQSMTTLAREKFDRAFALFKKCYASDDPRLAEILYAVGASYLWPREKCEEGLVLLRRYVVIQEKSLAPNHPELILIYQDMANRTDQTDRWEEEIDWRRKALAVAEYCYGNKDLRITQYLRELADCYREHEREADAIPLLDRAVAIHELTLGPEHPGACETLNYLGYACLQSGRFFDAEVYLQHGLSLAGKECPYDPVYHELEDSLSQLHRQLTSTDPTNQEPEEHYE